MKISRRTLVVGSIVALALLLVLQKDRENNLPAGKITKTEPVELTEISPQPVTGRPRVEITTSKGNFSIELRPDISPESAINFLDKWSEGYCDLTSFHRVEDWVIQGCDPDGSGLGGKNLLPTEKSTVSFLAGSVGVARKPYPKDISNDSQFFIVKKDSSFLDGEYTYLGQVVSGMETVNSISIGDKILSTIVLTK